MPLCHCQPAERPAGQLIGPRVCCLPRKNEALIERLTVPAEGSEPLHFDSEYSQGYLSQFTMCLWKCAPAAPTHPGGVGGGGGGGGFPCFISLLSRPPCPSALF